MHAGSTIEQPSFYKLHHVSFPRCQNLHRTSEPTRRTSYEENVCWHLFVIPLIFCLKGQHYKLISLSNLFDILYIQNRLSMHFTLYVLQTNWNMDPFCNLKRSQICAHKKTFYRFLTKEVTSWKIFKGWEVIIVIDSPTTWIETF